MPVIRLDHPRFWLHLRIAVTAAALFGYLNFLLTYGLTLLGVDGYSAASGPRLLVQVLTALLFGGSMSAVVGTVQWRAVQAAGLHRLAGDASAVTVDAFMRATWTVHVEVAPADVLAHASEAAACLGRATVTGVDAAAGTITLRASGPGGWGERVLVEVEPAGAGAALVTVTSRPQFEINVVDHGRNAANVERLVAWVRGLAVPAVACPAA